MSDINFIQAVRKNRFGELVWVLCVTKRKIFDWETDHIDSEYCLAKNNNFP